MGWKTSLIIVQHPEPAVTEVELLRRLGFDHVNLTSTWTLDEGMYPGDKSLSIGAYNGCLVLADDFQLTEALEVTKTPGQLVEFERVLTTLYPNSEVLTVACHSSVNYHLYSLVKGGQRIRYKHVVHGEPLREFGERLTEEVPVYGYSKVIDGQRLFRSTYKDDGEYDMTEDQLMEDFTFGVAQRLLGVEISTDEDEELMNEVPFNRYQSKQRQAPVAPTLSAPARSPRRQSWLGRLFGKKTDEK